MMYVLTNSIYRRNRGFTMVELLTVSIMFAIITAAIATAIGAGIKVQGIINNNAEDDQEARTVMDCLLKDIGSAYVSQSNQNTFFVCPGSSDGNVLMLSTRDHMIQMDTGNNSSPTNTNLMSSPAGSQTQPVQSDLALVSYYFDQQTGELRRFVTCAPNRSLVPGLSPGNSMSSTSVSTTTDYGRLISSHIEDIEFTFYDQNGNNYSDWDFDPMGTQVTMDTQTQFPSVMQILIKMKFPDGKEKQYTASITPAMTYAFGASTSSSTSSSSTMGGTP